RGYMRDYVSLRTVTLTLCLLCTAIVPAFGQLDRGTFSGTVTDPTGAPIAAARVSISLVATGAMYNTATNAVGQFSVPNLPVGAYQVTFEAAGFRRLVRSGVDLGATEVLRLDASLEVGSLTESIEVTGQAPRLQADTPEVATTLSNNQLMNLPLSFAGARQ